jgi:hypothetical protein
VTVEANRTKHLDDLALLGSMLTAADLRGANLSKGERRYLTRALPAANQHPTAGELPGALDGLARLQRLVT